MPSSPTVSRQNARSAEWAALGKMSVCEAQERYPNLCPDVRLLTGDGAEICEPYLAETMSDLARTEHLSMPALVWLIDHPEANKPLVTLNPDKRQRPARRFAQPLPAWDLEFELRQLHAEYAWLRYDRNAKTLSKGLHSRIVLVAMKSGVALPEHTLPGAMTIESLAGHVRVCTTDGGMDLCPKQVMLIQEGMPYRIEALAESALLFTISWSGRSRATVPTAHQVSDASASWMRPTVAPAVSNAATAVDAVTQASLDSFPASDAPAWTKLNVGGVLPWQ